MCVGSSRICSVPRSSPLFIELFCFDSLIPIFRLMSHDNVSATQASENEEDPKRISGKLTVIVSNECFGVYVRNVPVCCLFRLSMSLNSFLAL